MRIPRSDRVHLLDVFARAGWSGKIAIILATWFGAGLAPWVSGTFGSLAAIPLAMIGLVGLLWAVPIGAAIALIAVWSAGRCAKLLGKGDPSEVVVDEAVGMMVTLFLVPLSWMGIIVGFLLFRLFDVVKPWPIRQAERLRGGLGIVADDLLAGLYAHIVLRGILWIAD